MAKLSSSKFAVLLVDGYNLLAAKVKGVTDKTEVLQEESTGLGDDFYETTPTGVRKVALSQTGAFFDDATNGMHDALKASTLVVRLLCYAYGGNTIGGLFSGFLGEYQMSYAVAGTVGQLTKADAEYAISGQPDRGVIVHALGAETAAGDTTATPADYAAYPQRAIPITANSAANPSVVTTPVPHGLTTGQVIVIAGVTDSDADINGEQTVTVIDATSFSVPVDATTHAGTGGSFVLASTLNGAVGHLQVTALTLGGYDSATVTIQDSADNITYADLITFDVTTTAPSAQRVTAAGTVQRYVAQALTFQGAGSGPSITYLVGVAR